MIIFETYFSQEVKNGPHFSICVIPLNFCLITGHCDLLLLPNMVKGIVDSAAVTLMTMQTLFVGVLE